MALHVKHLPTEHQIHIHGDVQNAIKADSRHFLTTDFPSIGLAVSLCKRKLDTQRRSAELLQNMRLSGKSSVTENDICFYKDILHKTKTILPAISSSHNNVEEVGKRIDKIDTSLDILKECRGKDDDSEQNKMTDSLANVMDLQRALPVFNELFKFTAKKRARDRIRKSLDLSGDRSNLSKLRDNLRRIQKKLHIVRTISANHEQTSLSPIVSERFEGVTRFNETGLVSRYLEDLTCILIIYLFQIHTTSNTVFRMRL